MRRLIGVFLAFEAGILAREAQHADEIAAGRVAQGPDPVLVDAISLSIGPQEANRRFAVDDGIRELNVGDEAITDARRDESSFGQPLDEVVKFLPATETKRAAMDANDCGWNGPWSSGIAMSSHKSLPPALL